MLITGGAKRIGKGIALSLAQNGFDVVIHYSESRKEAEELVAKLKSFGIAAFCIKANLLKQICKLTNVNNKNYKIFIIRIKNKFLY